ncbi:tetratricopeptide repeat protein [Tautonia sociabilis]|uniref:Uncharacterized protein n=1 Tax=Tautonia sociabilis TaxID=2080755 RepID=A0A432MFH7_9BACT|nr:hypothetical protein [Tautonia sociabilis]RUL84933.1 hypothetical protein TsocGM_19525 [Tautonia sociabilis]
MNQIAIVAMLAWPVVTLGLCARLGAWRGVIASYLASHVLLSARVGVPLAGLPDFDKYMAANLGALIGILVFDGGRLGAFRPRWYDGFAIAVCLTPPVATMAGGLPFWDAVSACSDAVLRWGVPYLVGRLYAARPGASRDLAVGMAVCGVLMAPLIAFEVLGRQSISGLIYGIPVRTGFKYGLYNPVLMARNSLELNLWVSLTGLSAFALWCGRSVRSLWGVPFGFWTAVVLAAAILCHQSAAVGLLLLGCFLLSLTVGKQRLGSVPEVIALAAVVALAPKLGGRFTLLGLAMIAGMRYLRDLQSRRLLIGMALVTPIFLVIRLTKIVSTQILLSLAYMLLGWERTYSLSFRWDTEDRIIPYVLGNRPLLSWGTMADGRFDKLSLHGRQLVDSQWIIQFELYGLIGLAALYGMLCLPPLLVARRYPPRAWTDPGNAAVAGLLAVLLVFTLDSTLNAYVMPPIPLIAGLLMALPASVGAGSPGPRREEPVDRELERVERLAISGRPREAEAACRRLIAARAQAPAGQAGLADACDRLADLLEALGRPEEAEAPRRRALGLRAALAAADPADPVGRQTLAECGERLARNLARRGRFASAAEIRGIALEQRAALAAAAPDDAEALIRYADGLNDLAWLLAVSAGPAARDPRRAVAMAEQAARLGPDRKAYWNTLAACYRAAGDPRLAYEALARSLRLGPDVSGYDDALLVPILAELGDPDGASRALARLDARLAALGSSAPPALAWLRDEAEAALRSGSTAGAT